MEFILTCLKEDEDEGIGWQPQREEFRRWVTEYLQKLKGTVDELYKKSQDERFNPTKFFKTIKTEEENIEGQVSRVQLE
jgi:hypothetical protein